MNTDHPADIAPLSFGPGLAIGLLLILGLPSEPRHVKASSASRSGPESPDAPPMAASPALRPVPHAACH